MSALIRRQMTTDKWNVRICNLFDGNKQDIGCNPCTIGVKVQHY